MKSKKLLITFLLFLIAMLLGWFLRLSFVYPIGIVKYKYLVHAHSHVILLGWIFNAVFIAITAIYHPKGSRYYKKYRLLFWLLQTTILLAMIAFLFQGYALFSILFSTVFLIGTFIWVAWIWKVVRQDKSIGGRFILLSLLLLVLSSFGPLSLGGIMSTSLKETPAYPLSIYYYLHFLYNGFFIFGLIGVGFYLLDEKKIEYEKKYAEYFYKGMKWSIVPLYALSVVWVNASIWVNILGAVAAIIQLWGGFYLFKMFRRINKNVQKRGIFLQHLLLKIVLFVFTLKLIMQLSSSIQWVADVSFEARSSLIIGYIHLIMLGLISVFILWYFSVKGWYTLKNKSSRIGIYLFLVGVLLSEIILFTQGFLSVFLLGQFPSYFQSLLIVSGLMPLGILLLILGQFGNSTHTSTK